jgi:molecular chaperone GrpE
MDNGKSNEEDDTQREEDEPSNDDSAQTQSESEDVIQVAGDEKDRLICEYQDRLLRAQAEFQNFQRRMEKEFTEFKTYANAKLIENLLLVIDDFQNALSSDESGSNAEFLKGFDMIYNNLICLLEKEGLSEIETKEEKFDPWKHEAVEMVPDDEHPEHTVLDVVQRGYKFKDKVIRPAKVRVSTKPIKGEENSKEDYEDKDSEDNVNGGYEND